MSQGDQFKKKQELVAQFAGAVTHQLDVATHYAFRVLATRNKLVH